MRAQPRGRLGTTDRPYSALNLRLALAFFGLAVSGAFGLLFLREGHVLFGALSMLLAVTAVVDVVVIQLRRNARRKAQLDGRPHRR
jgi:hypothetical protein